MTIRVDTLIKAYLMLRGKRKALADTFNEADDKLKADMEKIEGNIHQRLLTEGADSFKTDVGTAYFQESYKASCPDWPTFWNWCAENKRVDMLEKRVSAGVVKAYEEETGELPPGISTFREKKVIVRAG